MKLVVSAGQHFYRRPSKIYKLIFTTNYTSSVCWHFDGKKCVLTISANCKPLLGCGSNQMGIFFDHSLFGTTSNSNFDNPTGVTDDSCDPKWNVAPFRNLWSFQHELGKCGQKATTEK